MSFLPANDPIYAAIRNTAAKFSTRKEIKMPETPMPKTTPKSTSANAQSAAKAAPKPKAKAAPKAAPAPKPAAEAGKESSRAKRAAYATGSLASPADIAAKLGMTPKAVRQKLRKIEATLPKGLLVSTDDTRWGFTDLDAICKLVKGE